MLSNDSDPLNILKECRTVTQLAKHVCIDQSKIQDLAQSWSKKPWQTPPWDSFVHYTTTGPRMSNIALLLGGWNFCFWSDPGQPKWSILYKEVVLNGYRAMAACIKRAVEEGLDLGDANILASLDKKQIETIFRSHQGEMPLLDKRLDHAHQIGNWLLEKHQGYWSNAIEKCDRKAPAIAKELAQELPCFRDLSTYQGHPVTFYKRAQITVIDLWGSAPQESFSQLQDLDLLTSFADYKIPQVLEALGVLHYSKELAQILIDHQEIPAQDPMEVEIRAAMVIAIEELRNKLLENGLDKKAYEIDWFLWNLGQTEISKQKPYHRTRTIFY